ncbi:MAG: PA14 domain-containing protein, partial [Bacteroidota bacterium]
TRHLEYFKAVKSGLLNEISLTEKEKEKYFAFIFDGYIKVSESNTYTFYLESNDGSILYIDDKKIIDNDDYHGVKEIPAKVYLAKGFHKIKLKYFQAGGSSKLKLSWEGKGIKKQEIKNLYYE